MVETVGYSNTLEGKQTYLGDVIIDVGYDGQEFFNYTVLQKEGGNDINNFSMVELQHVSLLSAYSYANPYNFLVCFVSIARQIVPQLARASAEAWVAFR